MCLNNLTDRVLLTCEPLRTGKTLSIETVRKSLTEEDSANEMSFDKPLAFRVLLL